ncbi:MAG: TrbG/VirB9 family P-type conjugative transfer protein, partial [Azoarcus sp.]|nr:TrbG/VirB9 family P-type conjugative transfer protein [Azoarcus sp.]
AAGQDPRIREVAYDPNKVYTIYTGVGFANLIQFAPDETLQAPRKSLLGMGDAGAWHVGAVGNSVSLKPAAVENGSNVVLVTNKRTYAFDLRPATKTNPPTYILRFTYPENQAADIAAERRRLGLTAASRAEKRTINTDYIWKGYDTDVLLAPTAAWDDGRFTRLVYNHAGELPVFYKVLPDGTEALVNYNVDDKVKETIVLQEVVRIVRARLNNQVIEIHNRSYKQPAVNRIPGLDLTPEDLASNGIEEQYPEREVYGRARFEDAFYACPHCGGIWTDDDHIEEKSAIYTIKMQNRLIFTDAF